MRYEVAQVDASRREIQTVLDKYGSSGWNLAHTFFAVIPTFGSSVFLVWEKPDTPPASQ